jgi:hypothetical protein
MLKGVLFGKTACLSLGSMESEDRAGKRMQTHKVMERGLFRSRQPPTAELVRGIQGSVVFAVGDRAATGWSRSGDLGFRELSRGSQGKGDLNFVAGMHDKA